MPFGTAQGAQASVFNCHRDSWRNVSSLVQLRDIGIRGASTGRAPSQSMLHQGYDAKD